MKVFSSPATGGVANSLRSTTAPEDAIRAGRIYLAAGQLLPFLECGQTADANDPRDFITCTLKGTDAEGFGLWKDAYEVCEAERVMFLRKFGSAIQARTRSLSSMLAMVSNVARLLRSHARRSDESQLLQQLSIPMPLAYVAARAAGIRPDDLVLEPSAGTGLLAIFAEIGRARLALNEYARVRGLLLEGLFPDGSVTRHGAAHMREWLKVIGLFCEIIAGKTRFFVPMTWEGPTILSHLMGRYRLVDVDRRH
jgi:hypothetical protein